MSIVDLSGKEVSTPNLTFIPFEVLAQYAQWCEDFEFENKKPHLSSLRNSVDNLLEESKESDDALLEFNGRDIDELPTENWNKLIDGFADTLFVAFNGMYKCYRLLGSEPMQALAATVATMVELAVANNSKRFPDGTVKKNDVGKVMKPDTFTPPSYLPLINASIEMNHDNVSAENRELSSGSII